MYTYDSVLLRFSEEVHMRGTYLRALGIALVLVVGLVFIAASGCNKKEPGKSAAPAGKTAPAGKEGPAAKVTTPADTPADAPADTPGAAQDDGAASKGATKTPAPADTPPEKKEPGAAEQLAALNKSFATYSLDAGAVENYLAGLDELVKKFPETIQAFEARRVAVRTRLDFLVLGLAGERSLEKRVLEQAGKLDAGKEPTDEQVAQYHKTLAAECQELGRTATIADDAKFLNDGAALLFYLSQARLEAAGRLAGNEIVVPADWLKPSPPTDALAPAEKKEGEAKGSATPAAADSPPPYVAAGGADAETLLNIARSETPVALRARYLIMQKMLGAVNGAESRIFLARWVQIADATGKILCGACGRLGKVREEYVDDVLFLKGNAGLVCPLAEAEMEKGLPVKEAVAAKCLSGLNLMNQDAALATPVNALVFRFFALANEMLAEPAADSDSGQDPFYQQLVPSARELAQKLTYLVALFPTIETFPAEKWEEMKEKLVLYSDLTKLSPSWEYMPFETIVVDEKGVSKALRPLAAVGEKMVKFIDKEAGLGFPGKLIIDVEAIAKELEAKNAELKAKKVKYDEKLGAFLFDVTIKGVVFKKPDFSIPSVIEAAKKLAENAGQHELKVFPYLKDSKVMNHERPAWPEYQDTVGKAGLYAVDLETPALLFKRVLDSLYYADYKDDRLLKGQGVMDTIPTVFFTEKFVDDSVLDTTYKRPILVYITEGGQVRFYPPTNRTSKGKMTAKRHPRKKDTEWPGIYRNRKDPRNPDPVWNLFMAYTKVGSRKFEAELVGIAQAMKKKWDNGNVFYVMAADKAKSGWVVKVADLLTRLPDDQPMAGLDKAYPGYACDAEGAGYLCINQIVVLFPDVEIPYLPGKKKVKEVGTSVYCDEKDIAAKIKAKRGAIKFCYDPELQKDPGLKGKVVFNFTIGASGRITKISVAKDGLGNKKVTGCTANIIKRINFRRPIGGECVIRYPYMFKP